MNPPDDTSVHPAPEALLRFIPTAARRVLDCACGDGRRGAAIKARAQAEVAGIERDPEAAALASKALDRVWCGDLCAARTSFPDDYFDCAVCDDVLAQVRDPKAALNEVRRVLGPGGLLLATVPNLQYHETVRMLAEGRWTYAETGIMAWNHLRFYTAHELVRTLRDAGFTVHKCGPLISDPPAALPRGEDGMIRMGRISIGPLNDDDYKAYLTQQYIVFAAKP